MASLPWRPYGGKKRFSEPGTSSRGGHYPQKHQDDSVACHLPLTQWKKGQSEWFSGLFLQVSHCR